MAIRPIKIMLDPGHNLARYNQGAAPGYWEGERMWRLYELLRPALEARGFIVAGTKSKCDQALDVVTRGRMARGYDVFISLHSNACGDPSVDRPVGICFVDDDCGPIDQESRELSVLLSEVVAATMGTRYKAQQYSQKSSRDRDGDGKKNDDYYGMLYGCHQVGVPGIILEHSFHTNPDAAAWLLDDANLRRLAEAEADALAEYYGMSTSAGASTSAPTTKEEFTVKVPVLRRGDKGPEVKAFQRHLIGYGYSCGSKGADGSFGPATESALKKYQKATGLEVDGVRGPATFKSMNGL